MRGKWKSSVCEDFLDERTGTVWRIGERASSAGDQYEACLRFRRKGDHEWETCITSDSPQRLQALIRLRKVAPVLEREVPARVLAQLDILIRTEEVEQQERQDAGSQPQARERRAGLASLERATGELVIAARRLRSMLDVIIDGGEDE